MEGNVDGIDAIGERIKVLFLEVDGDDLVLSEAREGLGDITAGNERNLTFARFPAHQHGNFFHCAYYSTKTRGSAGSGRAFAPVSRITNP